MTRQVAPGLPGASKRALLLALGAAVMASAGWVAFSTWTDVLAVGHATLMALWTIPIVIPLHLMQLVLSSLAWRSLFVGEARGMGLFFRLRLIREGVDSLLPVAQVGGEVLAARLLARRGVAPEQAGASVIVDLTLEVLAQIGFLLMGLLALAVLSGATNIAAWLDTVVLAGAGAAGFLIAQRLGLLRLIEAVTARIGMRFPALTAMSLTGLHAATVEHYRRPAAMLRGFLWHLLSWVLGVGESWLLLRALGVPATLPQSLVVESLGMLARSAGFIVPGALAVQEGGFLLACVAVGLPADAGLSLSLVKRVREVLVGMAGLALVRRTA